MAQKGEEPTQLRHLNSINDLTNSEIEEVFALADDYLDRFGDPAAAHRIAASHTAGAGHILATLFLEPSTRTRLSFESAMLRLGGQTITSSDPATSSAAKGESLADSVRVVSNYADAIVLRHPRDGAARLAAEFAAVPVINGGDGSHEHPTQTLCDLYTLRRENKQLKGLNVAISGDLRGSRTIHSFVYALARFGANLILMPAKGMGLPAHVDARLREEFRCVAAPKSSYAAEDASIDALYMTPEEPHQLSLIPAPDTEVDIRLADGLRQVDVVYVTRFQKERWAEAKADYPTVNSDFLKADRYKHSSVLHPLPRVGELDVAFDSDRRAVYFRQAAYGVPVRMALIALVLGLEKKKAFKRFAGGFEERPKALYEQPHDSGIACSNPNCVSHDPLERQYTRNKFHVHVGETPRLRCYYCETDIADFVVASRRGKRYKSSGEAGTLNALDLRTTLFFKDAAAAEGAGFSHGAPPRRQAAR